MNPEIGATRRDEGSLELGAVHRCKSKGSLNMSDPFFIAARNADTHSRYITAILRRVADAPLLWILA